MSAPNSGSVGFPCVINGRRVRLIRSTENADGSMTIEGVDEDAEALIYAADEGPEAVNAELLAVLKVALDDIEHLSRAAKEVGWTTDNEAATVRRGRAAIAKAEAA